MRSKDDGRGCAEAGDDPVARLRQRADNMATSAAAMKKIADAADPLYKTLDDGQKRRLAILTHRGRPVRRRGWRHRGFERGMGGDRDRDGGRDRGGDRDRDGDRGDRGAGSSGSSRQIPIGRKAEKAAGFRRLFRFPFQRLKRGNIPVTLLDIARSLC